jgi:AraC family transcriptional regulator
MEYRVEFIQEKKIIGQRLEMTFADNKTFSLWSGFMPRRKEITGTVSPDLISMQVYGENFDFINFDINRTFEKWAAMEAGDFENIPENMEACIIPSGYYAVFTHKGPANEGEKTFRYIFGKWLPESGFHLDNRPHFEILGSRYKQNSPDSEEEFWIPVRQKQI